MHTTQDLITIAHLTLDAVTGGAGDANAKDTMRRLDLVQKGQLDREDFAFFLDNQRRDAKLLVDR
jgi:hypothetical protein